MSDEAKVTWEVRTGKRVWTPEEVRRVRACVLACEGIPTEALESGALAKAFDLLKIGYIHDDPASRCAGDEPECVECQAVNVLRALGRLP